MQVPRIFWAALSAIFLLTSEAGVFLDQEFFPSERWAYRANSDYTVGQTFTVGKTGKLVRFEADLALEDARTDLTVTLVNKKTSVQKTITVPFWKIHDSTGFPGFRLCGIDVSSLNFNVTAGDVCLVYFKGTQPFGSNEPAIVILSGTCGYSAGSFMRGATVNDLVETPGEDMGMRTFVSTTSAQSGPPTLYEFPENEERWLGDNVHLPVFATGAEPLTYRWFKDGAAMETQTAANLDLLVSSTNIAGAYFCIVSNTFGSVTTKTAQVTIRTGPVIAGSSLYLRPPGSDLTLETYVRGKGSLSYQWFFQGQKIGANTSLPLGLVRSSQAGEYLFRASDTVGTTEFLATVSIRDDSAKIKWSVSTGTTNDETAPVTSKNGRIYFSSKNVLAEFNSFGQRTAWAGKAGNAWVSPIIVGNTGAFDPSGETWQLSKFTGGYGAALGFNGNSYCVAATTNGIAYFYSNGYIYAYNLLQGTNVWYRSIQSGFSPGLRILVDSQYSAVYALENAQTVLALDAQTGRLLWRETTPDRYISGGAIGPDGCVYVHGDTGISAFEPSSGELRWRRLTSGGNGFPLVDGAGIVYAMDGHVAIALNGATGQLIWSHDLKDWNFQGGGALLLADNTILYWHVPYGMLALDSQTGDFFSDYIAPAALRGMPSVGPDGTIYFTATDHKLYALKTTAPLLPGPWSHPRGSTLNNGVADTSGALPAGLVITRHPQSATVGEGDRLELSVAALGIGPISYQWWKGAGPIPGATATNLVLNPIKLSDAGTYFVVVTNSVGSLESTRARITVATTVTAQITTIAGNGQAGYQDALDPLASKLNWPAGIAVDPQGTIYLAEPSNHLVRVLAPGGFVGAWAGHAGQGGYLEASGTNAYFRAPLGLSVNAAGDLLVADTLNHRLRSVQSSRYRNTSLLAGSGLPGFLSTDAASSQLNAPVETVEGPQREVYFIELGNHSVRKINRDGIVEVVAGTGFPGFADGSPNAAQFNQPMGLAILNGDVLVADSGNHRIRRISKNFGQVETIAGNGTAGFAAGLGTNATLNAPARVCVDPLGNIYFSENGNHAIRRMDTNGWVSRVAGGVKGFQDGDSETAKFAQPAGICLHPDGSLLVADSENQRIRRIVLNGQTNAWLRAEGALLIDLNPTLKILGEIGAHYRIESREQVGASEWVPVESIQIQSYPQIWVDPRPDRGQMRLFRAVKE